MRKIKRDLTGLRVFKWTVLFRNGASPDNKVPLWRCVCDCGTERDIRTGSLKNGTTKSCGCLKPKTPTKRPTVIGGERFGRLLAIERLPKSLVLCRCDCGNEQAFLSGNLRRGATQSCGCLRRENTRNRSFLHGMIKHPAHRSWAGAKKRCFNSADQDFHLYGGRGIKICDRWMEFNLFWEDMGPTWFVGATIERIDGNGNYEPSNCEWRTIQEQQRNRANNVMLETPYGVMIVSEYAKKVGVIPSIMHARIRNGWTDNGNVKRLGTRAEYEKR